MHLRGKTVTLTFSRYTKVPFILKNKGKNCNVWVQKYISYGYNYLKNKGKNCNAFHLYINKTHAFQRFNGLPNFKFKGKNCNATLKT